MIKKYISIITSFLMPGFIASADLENPLNSSSFAELVENVAGIVAKIGAPLAVVFLIWAGFLFITSRGNEEQLKKAKTTFFWTIIGTAILLGAWAIASAVNEFIGGL